MSGWTKADNAERDRCCEELRRLLPPGSTLHTVLRHVARSGMMRRISPVIVDKTGDTLHPDYLIAVACRIARPSKAPRGGDGVNVHGCGMDAGFWLTYSVAAAIYPKGFGCIGEGCPSNDHANGDHDYTPHPGCGKPDKRGHRDHWHQDGGYALRHRWI